MGKAARGKKESTAPVVASGGGESTLEGELQRAETAIRNNQFQVNAIHKQWRTYLARLSYMVLVIAFHQMQNPSAACIVDVKKFNEVTTEPIDGYKVTLLVLSDSMIHLLAIVMAASLSFYLQHQPNVIGSPAKQQEAMSKRQLLFADARYMMANACIPPLLALYFGSKKTNEDGSPRTLSCLDHTLLEQAGVEPAERRRSLPVVLVFHVIVTACMWFMDMQQNQVLVNLEKVDKLREDLQEAQQQAKSKKKQ
mmetsp:Transcript_9315/g.12353  ORF Transcript_9315/g.12353 Transcript_9315/m.12353 type:complete len:253 (-) Transcript_9315:287-1045(-)|eukprot:CAMPEP_0198147084 /NCGR_PEP_ID=MMETSP1443-20131203/33194_1 /TAXON_ID=186043 /ORGANISM="Entomoneis sp., Strain CCMP2396" /LENGTH=252 /DNA_ID=CAMNT_0043811239 /DNA_START=178 /DNA_END=936 /DNA_ORIENTATION=+